VVIIGAGLTGCACASSCAAAGLSTVVLEADRVGAGSTAGSPGLIREDFDGSFQETAAAHGLRSARALWTGLRRASLDFAAALKRHGIRCDLAPQTFVQFVPATPDAVKRLRREYEARRAAGLDHTWLTAAALRREMALDGGGAIRTRGFSFDPFRATLGLADAAVSRGADVFERTLVRRIRANRKAVDVVTAAGTVRAQSVVIATGAPLPDLRGLRRHLHPQHGYAVVTAPLPAAVRRELGGMAAAVRDAASPPHFLRWLKDDRVLFTGADQSPTPSRARERFLVQRGGQLMYELSTIYPAISGSLPEWIWDFRFETSSDGLPFIGLHRNFPRHFFALGHGRHGAAVAWLAARILLRHLQNEPGKADEAFGFARILK
jgi:glycine/D-amino acid oxidase-like deaminating enzyme